MLARLFRKKAIKQAARRLYDQLSAAAREPSLYGFGKVADTPDGRFELLALHAAVFFTRLSKQGEQAEETAQEVFDILFSAMDHALRELGVGDISVGKRIRKLAESFYGRLAIYYDGFAQLAVDRSKLEEAIATHVLGDPDKGLFFAQKLADRAISWTAQLNQISTDKLLSGDMPLPN